MIWGTPYLGGLALTLWTVVTREGALSGGLASKPSGVAQGVGSVRDSASGAGGRHAG